MSGESNVELWLASHGFESTPERVDVILQAAKASSRVLSDGEIEKLLEADGRGWPRRLSGRT